MKPTDALDIQAYFKGKCGDKRWQDLLQTYVEISVGKKYLYKEEEWEKSDHKKAIGVYAKDILEVGTGADCFFVKDEMSDLVSFASSKLDETDEIDINLVPTDKGFAYFEKPLLLQDVRGREMLINLILWKKVFGEDYQPHINFQRAEKMADKGYCINGEKTIVKFKHIKYQPLDYICNEDDKCIICMDIFTETHKWLTFGCVCNVKMHLYCYARYIRNPTIDARDNILCPHCRTPNIHQCPCTLLNFMSSFNHWAKLCNNDKECNKCIKNNYNDQCLKWYYQCRVCVS